MAGRAPGRERTGATVDEPLLSLRTFLDGIGDELRVVEGAHWDLEIGAIAELSYRQERTPALLFDRIPGYPAGMRVLTGSTASARRLGRTLRLGDDLDDRGVVAALRNKPSRWAAAAKDHPVEEVSRAPFLDNVVEGDAIDLLAFPVPRWHAEDGGRFIGTGCLVVTSDPETGVPNGGCYRMQVQDSTLLWYARVDNATDKLAYSATSILTQTAPGKAPLPGRSFKLGLQASF